MTDKKPTTRVRKKNITQTKVTEKSNDLVTSATKIDQEPNLQGFIENYTGGKLYGWVYDASQPDQVLAIKVYCGDTLVAEALADVFRGDLKDAGFGNGKHGFVVAMNNQTMLDIESYSVRLISSDDVAIETNEFFIDFDPQSIVDIDIAPTDTKDELVGSVRGYIEAFENGKLSGWVFDSKQPDDALAIKVYYGDVQVARGVADIYRKDLKEADFGNGRHGFSVELLMPTLFDNKSYPIILSLDDDQLITVNKFEIKASCLIFDVEFVADQLLCTKETAFDNFMAELEKKSDLSCHPLFDPTFYKKQLDYLNISTTDPLIVHYLTEGWKFGVDPHPLFDTEYYRNCLGIGGFKISPLQHYLMNASKLLADPTPFFDEKYYNHHCALEKLNVKYDSRLQDFLAREKWCNFHPDITPQSIGPMRDDVQLIDIIERDKRITPQDFVEVINNLRCAKFLDKSPTANKIKLSVIILNYNKLVHTILSAYCAHLALQDIEHELIVVDNGSDFFCYQNIAHYVNYIPNCRVLRIERNRFFGEGNNIALDQAKGDFISFLNNDAYVNKSTFTKLLHAFQKDTRIGATGPVFMQHNYTLQEFGGKVSGCGQIIQIGKHAPLNQSLISTLESLPKFVDYCSAACCVISRSVLEQVGGFDYIFEPFYYEDTDLFSRIRCAGHELYIESDAHVMHFENTSTKSYLNNDEFHSLIATNKRKFANRWFGKLEQGVDLGDKTPRLPLFSETTKPIETTQRAFVYSPFPLGPGGGEKYILTLASVLAETYQTTIIFPEIYSQHRLKMVAEDLGVSVTHLKMATWNEALKEDKPDIFVVMGNEVIPSVPAIGRRNFYHCQFPFPLQYMPRPDALESLYGYEGFIVNSEFTQKEISKQLREYGLPNLPIHIVYPPCWDGDVERQLERIENKKYNEKTISIVNVGRFFRHGHNKRQDVVLDIIKQLKMSVKAKDWTVTGTLLGGVSKSEESYYQTLLNQATQMGVAMAVNVERSEIEAAYQGADIYIHAAGFGKQEGYSPHELEHFGIAVVEAMINGVIPLVYKAAGPLEIVNKVGVGEVFGDVDEAVEKVWELIEMPLDKKRLIQEEMLQACQEFSSLSFCVKLNNIVNL
ncbi:MAG: glycosyltransferase [Methylococcaceae bacterium]|nr:glycosyltransferase [Methylococcaceae bacterium]